MNDPSQFHSAAAVTVRDLYYRWPAGEFQLQDVAFELAPGERVGLIGPSGAGKSTLLMHLNGLLPDRTPRGADEARVSIDDMPVTKENLQQIRQRVGFLFQDPDDQLFCPTVREDVAFGPLNLGCSQRETRERISSSLRQVGLQGYESRSTVQLSLGERKRVCLAGVLACRPDVLVLDEPFSNLDPRNRKNLQELLAGLPATQLLATHDLNLVAEFCSRVIVIDGGLIRAEGPAETLLRDGQLMHEHGLEIPWCFRRPEE
jgi:energy-coupling factor transporter ATP-binding protein EcfA2